MEGKHLKFPDGFLWGSATAAHQIEGGTTNDWSQWEQSTERIKVLKEDGKDPADFISGQACASYERTTEDLATLTQLNQKIYRFSIEWSRIEPEEGRFNGDAMNHYINFVKELRKRGITPMVTLWHFTNPIWFSVKGGFLNKHSPELYKRFIRYVVDNLKGDIGLWITFNEATTVYDVLSYLRGQWPPQHRNIFKWWRFRKNILKAHTLAYREIKNIYRNWPSTWAPGNNQVVSHNIEPLVGAVESNSYWVLHPLLEKIGVGKLLDRMTNHWLWRQSLPYQDFLGLNYYTIKRLPGSWWLKKQEYIPEMGWEIYPEGIYRVLKALKKFKKPIFITENGIADATDHRRQKFISEHLYWIWQAIQEGVQVRGYMYWSLLDNFEWAKGFFPRFGLVEVDRRTMIRKIRPSATWYATIIKENSLTL